MRLLKETSVRMWRRSRPRS